MDNTSPMLSNPSPTSSAGKSSAGRKSMPIKSRTVLLYSDLLSRRRVGRPGRLHLAAIDIRCRIRQPVGDGFSILFARLVGFRGRHALGTDLADHFQPADTLLDEVLALGKLFESQASLRFIAGMTIDAIASEEGLELFVDKLGIRFGRLPTHASPDDVRDSPTGQRYTTEVHGLGLSSPTNENGWCKRSWNSKSSSITGHPKRRVFGIPGRPILGFTQIEIHRHKSIKTNALHKESTRKNSGIPDEGVCALP